ncbi:hypothetical protein [Actinophytocola sp. NPDC049390]|uniref:hypothetical protein n=1 Tax=Actinophytocola sp. NPDC049390 TaxID=3363894 RepID=UPI0037A3B511
MTGYTVAPATLTKAADAAAQVFDMVNKDGRIVDDTNNATAAALSQEQFQLGKALKTAADLWYQQMSTLIRAVNTIEQNLNANAHDYRAQEKRTETVMREIGNHFE